MGYRYGTLMSTCRWRFLFSMLSCWPKVSILVEILKQNLIFGYSEKINKGVLMQWHYLSMTLFGFLV